MPLTPDPDDATWPTDFVAVSGATLVGDDGTEYSFDLREASAAWERGETVTLRFEHGRFVLVLDTSPLI